MTTHTLRLIDEYLTQGGYAPNIDADTLDREAALVAAAPDLLAALKSIAGAEEMHGDSFVCDFHTLQSIARHAIRKTGA